MVDVDLEDLFFAQILFDAQRQQDLEDLANIGALAREVEVSRNLLRDRAGTPAPAPGHVVNDGAQHPQRIDPGVFEKAFVLGRQQRTAHHQREFGCGHKGAPLLAKFAHQDAVAAVDAQWNLGPVIEQHRHAGQTLIGQHDGQHAHHHCPAGCGDGDCCQQEQHFPETKTTSGALAGWSGGRRRVRRTFVHTRGPCVRPKRLESRDGSQYSGAPSGLPQPWPRKHAGHRTGVLMENGRLVSSVSIQNCAKFQGNQRIPLVL